MRRLVTVVTPAILLVGLIPFDLTALSIPVVDTGVPHNKTTTSQTKASNSSAIAMITGAWTTPSNGGGSNG